MKTALCEDCAARFSYAELVKGKLKCLQCGLQHYFSGLSQFFLLFILTFPSITGRSVIFYIRYTTMEIYQKESLLMFLFPSFLSIAIGIAFHFAVIPYMKLSTKQVKPMLPLCLAIIPQTIIVIILYIMIPV